MSSNGIIPQFHPQYQVKVPNAAKNGEVVEFFVETVKDGDERAVVVIRVHDDFVWLLHCLKTQDNVVGVIFPPLPSPPATSLQAAEKKTRKQVGSKAKVLVGDDYGENCRAYEKFLSLCVTHPRFGHSSVLEKFLCEKEAPERVKVRRGIFGSLSKAVDDLRFMNFKDTDEEFQQTRVSNNENVKHMKEASSQYQSLINSECRVSSSYNDIQQSLKELSSEGGNTEKLLELCQLMSQAVEHAAERSSVAAINRERTVGATLKLYAGYANSEHDMLHKRVLKIVELENAKKTFEKAKPQKKAQAEEVMKKLEKELADMTSLAKPELERHNRQRILAFQSALVQMADAEVKTARDSLAVFTKLCSDVQKIELE